MIHDTSEMAFACEQARRGLTPLGAHRQGSWWHAALAVSAEGVRAPLGLFYGHRLIWSRRVAPKEPWRQRFQEASKESRRWIDGVAAVRTRLGEAARPIHMMDREGDSYELFAALTAARDRWIIRLHYDRLMTRSDAYAFIRLSDLRPQLPVLVTQDVTVTPQRAENRVQRLTYPARDWGVATMAFAACPVTLQRPRDHLMVYTPQHRGGQHHLRVGSHATRWSIPAGVVAVNDRADRHRRPGAPDRDVVSHTVRY